MKFYTNLSDFYNSKDWFNCKMQVLNERITKDGKVICEHCGKEILKDFNPTKRNNRNAIVYHHKEELNITNVNIASVSINPEKIAILHWQCHNEVHNRFNGSNGNNLPEKKVYLITGSPLSGKSTFARERAESNDLIIDIDDIWQFVTRGQRYFKPNFAKPFVFAIYNSLIETIKTTRLSGSWHNVFVIESLPTAKQRSDRARELQAEIIIMEASKEECLQRLQADKNGRNIKDYTRYIEDYFKWFC